MLKLVKVPVKIRASLWCQSRIFDPFGNDSLATIGALMEVPLHAPGRIKLYQGIAFPAFLTVHRQLTSYRRMFRVGPFTLLAFQGSNNTIECRLLNCSVQPGKSPVAKLWLLQLHAVSVQLQEAQSVNDSGKRRSCCWCGNLERRYRLSGRVQSRRPR